MLLLKIKIVEYLKNILFILEYLISLGCTGYHNGEFVVFHRLYDVCSLTVISDRNTVGYYDMNSKVTLS